VMIRMFIGLRRKPGIPHTTSRSNQLYPLNFW